MMAPTLPKVVPGGASRSGPGPAVPLGYRGVARLDQQHPLDASGNWFVDTRCIGCDVARHWAPGLIAEDANALSYIQRQPETPEEEAALWRAAVACPTQSIGNRVARRPPHPPFPFQLTTGVHAMGHNDESSFGAHSYLVRHGGINFLVDSPRFLRSLAARVDDLGGIQHVLLTHRDDVADADRWADRYGARVWIHAADAAAAPYASEIVPGEASAVVTEGVTIVPIAGHTRGSVAIHVDDRFLFTGDSLHWDHHRRRLDVFAGATWYSWARLADAVDRLAGLRVEWVFPGHGMWHLVGADAYAAQMAALGPAMRASGQGRWL
jgi:glyoxylase-like metal-dependent hydrolase (beta-lactamase superfamily II)/ferredoxin